MRTAFVLVLIIIFNILHNSPTLKKASSISILKKKLSDTSQAKKLIRKAAFYLDISYNLDAHRDSAKSLLERSEVLLRQSSSSNLVYSLHLLQARIFLRSGDMDNAKKIYMAEISKCQASGSKKEEAMIWYQFTLALSRNSPFESNVSKYDENYPTEYEAQRNLNFENALSIAREIQDKDLQAVIIANQVSHYLYLKKYDAAQLLINELVNLVPYFKTFKLYELKYLQAKMASDGSADLVEAISFGLEAIKDATESHSEFDLGGVYIVLAIDYSALGERDKGVEIFRTYIANQDRFGKPLDATMLRSYLLILFYLGKNQEAINIVHRFDRKSPYYTSSIEQRFCIAQASAIVNTQLKRYDAALSDYDEALRIGQGWMSDNLRLIILSLKGDVYRLWGKYEQARPYYENMIKSGNRKYYTNIANAHRSLFRMDTLTKNYKDAIGHLMEAYRIQDSARNEEVMKNISRLNVEFATAQKEKDIQNLNSKLKLQQLDSINRTKNIQLLKSKFDLEHFQMQARRKDILLLNTKINLQNFETIDKEKNIRLLNAEVKLQRSDSTNRIRNIQVLVGNSRFQKSELQKTSLIKNITITGALLLLIILVLVYKQFQTTKEKNDIIEHKNHALGMLLEDKEVLMKEIHHRVKNNLQMILSLLESQSAFLENDALSAIQTSQNRVQAMSLIHQKLYLTSNVTNINMAEYLRELIGYLQDSFDTGQRIYFSFTMDAIELDISQAVPLGLIVNEATTNSIKYAFPVERTGEISVSFKDIGDRLMELIIKDNGIGLPDNFALNKTNSLGLRLIKGLADNLEANLTVKTHGGTFISLIFAYESAFRV